MRRADRLFKITQLLSSEKPITAQQLADVLETSVRTVYRDIKDLMLSDIPIVAQTGIGYQLTKGFRIPPLMFTSEELTALVVGARFTQASADTALAHSASTAIDKIKKVVPENLQKTINQNELYALDFRITTQEKYHMQVIRESIQQRRYIEIYYVDEATESTQRRIRPLGLFYWGKFWTVVAWCELRDDFRQFRIDRIKSLNRSMQLFKKDSKKSLIVYLNNYCREENE